MEEYSFLCPSQKRADEMRASWGTKASGSGHGWEGHLSARARKELDVPVCRDGMSKQPKFRFKLHEARHRGRGPTDSLSSILLVILELLGGARTQKSPGSSLQFSSGALIASDTQFPEWQVPGWALIS